MKTIKNIFHLLSHVVGAIEISILSKHYQTEINVVNTESGRIDQFGKPHGYVYYFIYTHARGDRYINPQEIALCTQHQAKSHKILIYVQPVRQALITLLSVTPS